MMEIRLGVSDEVTDGTEVLIQFLDDSDDVEYFLEQVDGNVFKKVPVQQVEEGSVSEIN